ncbi:hypothetical protein Taro_016649 [Colocasia esculenta]|uniref:Uncharacterized protein n=1 Tax=Colocasia esculenta TaxID=4460 RepID=A0A843UKY0_COLES|nr:hypothetical protein [Colocasia esculenta]
MACLTEAGSSGAVDVASSGRKSYAQIIASTKPPPVISIGIKPPSLTDSGEPAVFFSTEEVGGIDVTSKDAAVCVLSSPVTVAGAAVRAEVDASPMQIMSQEIQLLKNKLLRSNSFVGTFPP